METDSDDDAESPLALEEHMLSGSEEWHVYAHPSTKPWSEVVKVFNKAIGHYIESTEHVWHAHKHSKNLLFLPFDDVMRIGHFPQAKPLRKRWEKEISGCLPCAMAYRRQASQYFSENLSFDHGPVINDDAHRINRCLSSFGGATSERDMKHQEATALIALFEVLLFPRLLTRATPRLPKPLSQVAPKVCRFVFVAAASLSTRRFLLSFNLEFMTSCLEYTCSSSIRILCFVTGRMSKFGRNACLHDFACLPAAEPMAQRISMSVKALKLYSQTLLRLSPKDFKQKLFSWG